MAECINEKLAHAEAKRLEETGKLLQKVKHMNKRVSEAEKKRGEMEPYDYSEKEAKLQLAEAKRLEETGKLLERVQQMNKRVSEAERKRGEIGPYDFSHKEAKLQSAEERKAALLKETQDRAAANVAKVAKARQLAQKRLQRLQLMQESLQVPRAVELVKVI
jgi:hypothetical protein